MREDLPAGTESAVVARPGEGASLAQYADAAAEQAPWTRFLVVAHSSGGVTAAELLSRHPGRAVGVLGVAAVVPRPGRSFVQTMPLPGRIVLPIALKVAGTRPPAKAIRAGCGDGLPEETVERIVGEYEPEPLALYRDTTSPRRLPRVRGYLSTRDDRELGVATQRRCAEALEATWTQELPTGHLPMLEDPRGVARALQRALEELGR